MCGIIGVLNKDKNQPANKDIIDIFEDQKSRGTEGFGTIFIKDNKLSSIERSTETVKFMLDLMIDKNQTNCIISHHRQPTSTKNKLKQTHPIIIRNGSLKYDYAVIHNGCISNAEELKKKHEGELGFSYSTFDENIKTSGYWDKNFNDSEAFAIELTRFIEKQTKKIDISGSAAFIAVQIEKESNKIKNIFFGRNSSATLKLSKSEDKIIISSEGKGKEIESDTLFKINLKDFTITDKSLKFKEIPATTAAFDKDDDDYGYYNGGIYYGSYDKKDRKEKYWGKRYSIPNSAEKETVIKGFEDKQDEWKSFLEEKELEDALSKDPSAFTKIENEYLEICENFTENMEAINDYMLDETLKLEYPISKANRKIYIDWYIDTIKDFFKETDELKQKTIEESRKEIKEIPSASLTQRSFADPV